MGLLFLWQWGRTFVCLPAWSTWQSCVVPYYYYYYYYYKQFNLPQNYTARRGYVVVQCHYVLNQCLHRWAFFNTAKVVAETSIGRQVVPCWKSIIVNSSGPLERRKSSFRFDVQPLGEAVSHHQLPIVSLSPVVRQNTRPRSDEINLMLRSSGTHHHAGMVKYGRSYDHIHHCHGYRCTAVRVSQQAS